ncbi:hypothetical protein [Maribacter hydrothermalis]|uniref:Uncharacterized protein n=1 Tax=Maribacter hydrothermalis TaxID=1836467 RepID=A0A1B7ZEI8_9FLAO|nr:hypothetical protein [Maribacter hydrothermalis]APQ17467.1 hypothetical protein BTR34_09075 [Maribacter hydrothermalis]OBR41944.1 hypothetical protein A9200_00710 [Maribacter hydrothermalis]
MKEVLRKHLGSILLVVAVITVIHWNESSKEKRINENKAFSYAKILSVKKGKRSRVSYKFLHNDKWIYETDSWNGKAEKNEFYKVIYDRNNPEYSDILLTRKSINPLDLIEKGKKIKGKIERIAYPSNTYLDLYISYNFLGERYEFRTRKHKDSIDCIVVSKCEGSEIDLRISDYQPELNNLFFESYDRIKIREKINRKYNK